MTAETPDPYKISDGQRDLAFQLFVASNDLMKNEATLVWNRYSAMLTANAIVAIIPGAIFSRSDASRTDLKVIFFSSLFGIVLSIFWYRLTKRGWDLSHMWRDEAKKYKFPEPHRNPLAVYDDWCKENGKVDSIRYWANAVIVLFVVGYAITAIATACALFCQHWCVIL